MDHTPNKQSKTDAGDILTLEDFSDACASQRDVFDTEYEGSSMESQFSQSSFQFASKRPTPTTVNSGERRYDQIKDVNEYLNQYLNIRMGIRIIFEYSMVNYIIFSHRNT